MKKEIIRIKKHKILIKEFTVRDVCIILANFNGILTQDEVDFELLYAEKIDLLQHIARSFIVMPEKFPIEKLTLKDIETITPVFMRVNQRFFSSNKNKPKPNPRAKKTHLKNNNLQRDINRSISNMIERGHKDVLDYAWSFYLDVIEEQKKEHG